MHPHMRAAHAAGVVSVPWLKIALAVQPWGVLLPVLAIALLTIGTGLVGDGIARAAAGIDRGRGGE